MATEAVAPAKKRGVDALLRGALVAAGVVAGLLALTALTVYVLSEMRINRVYSTQPAPITVPAGMASIERGRHLVANVMACVDCHGQDLGGKVVTDDPAIGRAYAANLTTGKGGVLGRLSDADLVRILRHGVKPDGRSLVVMPVDDYVALNEADMAAIVAYLRSLPPVDREHPQPELRALGRLLLALNQANLLSAETVPQSGGFPEAVPPGPTVEYGRYLARTSGCMGCHGATLSGGPIPGAPPDFGVPPNITPAGAVAGWTDEQIIALIRSGMRPDGSQIRPIMPYAAYAGMTDDEVLAIVRYLRSVPAKPFGNR